jgi:Na+-driven multidrug efflux pump
VSVIFIAGAWPIVGFFTSEPDVARHAVNCLRTVSVAFMAFGFGMTLSSALNGAGDTWTPTWINLGAFWCFEIPLAYVLALPIGWGPSGVYYAIAAAFTLHMIASAVVFKRGRWKERKV